MKGLAVDEAPPLGVAVDAQSTFAGRGHELAADSTEPIAELLPRDAFAPADFTSSNSSTAPNLSWQPNNFRRCGPGHFAPFAHACTAPCYSHEDTMASRKNHTQLTSSSPLRLNQGRKSSDLFSSAQHVLPWAPMATPGSWTRRISPPWV